jgi:predicted O-linked N-acetylglucosamine transferase (SPINDLY family)
MDDLFARILAEDPQGVLVFFQAPSRAVTQLLGSRLERALAARGIAPRGQVKFLPRLAGPLFRGALAAADVVLDTLRWSGATPAWTRSPPACPSSPRTEGSCAGGKRPRCCA